MKRSPEAAARIAARRAKLTCEKCGREFLVLKSVLAAGRHAGRFCSNACQSQMAKPPITRKYPPEVARARRGSKKNHRQRAQAYGVRYEPVTPRRVFERDNWRCMICLERINRDARMPEPDCATLDHVIPMVSGGDHVMDNLQTAHLRCNVKKGATLDPSQAALSLQVIQFNTELHIALQHAGVR